MERPTLTAWLFAALILTAGYCYLGCGGGDGYTGGDITCIATDNAQQSCQDGSGNVVDSPCANATYRDQSGDPNCASKSDNPTTTTVNPTPVPGAA
jgi:hypothetical protein